MKNLILLVGFIFFTASANAFETKTEDCMMSFEDNQRTAKNVTKDLKKKQTKSKAKTR